MTHMVPFVLHIVAHSRTVDFVLILRQLQRSESSQICLAWAMRGLRKLMLLIPVQYFLWNVLNTSKVLNWCAVCEPY